MLPWRQDAEILARMQEGARLRSHGLTGPQIALELKISVPVVYEDRDRLLELRKEQANAAVDEHIENLRQQAAEIRADLAGTDRRSLNIGQLRALLRQIEMDIAKLDGSLVDRREISGKDGGPIAVDAARTEILSRLDRLAAAGATPESSGGTAAEDG